jgi:hypothetical protein
MPWYWTDDLANTLAASGRINASTAQRVAARPVAIRRAEISVEAAANGCLEDDEIPLAA